MKNILFFTLLALVSITSVGAHAENEKDFGIEIIDKTVFKIPLDKFDIKVRVAYPGKTSTVLEETKRKGGILGMNASFFCPAEKAYSRCGGDNGTSSDRVVDGTDYSMYPDDTGVRGIFGFDKNGQVLFVQKNKGSVVGYAGNTNSDKRKDIRNGIGNFPILLDKGLNPLEYYSSEVSHPKMIARMTRAFICTPKEGDFVYMGFVPNKTIHDMPFYLKESFDCYFALNLDAGSSSALVWKGKHLLGPGREVVDGYVVTPKDWWIDEIIKNYTFSKEEKSVLFALHERIQKKVIGQDARKREEVLNIISTFEQNPSSKSNISKRAILRALKKMIENTQT